MEFRILGPLEVVEDGESLPLAAGKQRALLAMLLLRANEVVPVDELVDALWGEQPPGTAAKSVQIYVSQLRKLIDDGALRTRSPGYELRVEPDELDLHRFRHIVKEGKEALDAGQPQVAAAKLREALTLWRGPPLAEFAYESFAQPEIARLEEERLNALEERIDADLALGQHAALIGELEALRTRNPLRERLSGQLMLALYRSGRQAEALDVYQESRSRLREELGLEPGRALQELQQGILRQDAALAAPKARETPALRRPRTLITVGLILLAATVVAALLEITRGSSANGLRDVQANALGVIDPKTNAIVAEVPVGSQPANIVDGAGSLWVTNEGDYTVSRVNPRTLRQIHTISLSAAPDGLAAAPASIWVATNRGISVIDPAFNSVARTIPTGGARPSPGYPFSEFPTSIAFTPTAAWITTSTGGLGGHLVKANRITGRSLGAFTTGNGPQLVTANGTQIWVTDLFDQKLERVDPTGAILDPIPIGHAPARAAVGFGSLWVADSDDNDIKRVNPDTGSVIETIPVGRHPGAIAAGLGSVWVANEYSETISRIDPQSNDVVRTIHIGNSPVGLAIADGRLWVTVQGDLAPPPADSKAGGVIRLAGRPNADPVQYGLDAYAAQLQYATCATLLNYPDRAAPAGNRLQPEIARAMPHVSADGRIYTFTLRSDYRFSPPSGALVTAATFKYSIERALDHRSTARETVLPYVQDVVGAAAFEKGKTRHIAGVTAHDNRLTFKLTKADGGFLTRLAMPFFCPVPTDTPIDAKGMRIASAGPYYVADSTPTLLILKRNPNYAGSRARRPGEIVYTGGDEARSTELVLRGEIDYASVSAADAVRVHRRYPKQFFVNPFPAVDSFVFNTRRPPFSNVKVRRAVNYAIDRRALASEGGFFVGDGAFSMVPTDQYLPSVLPGYKDVSIYPFTPDLARAKRLAGNKHRRAMLYTCDFSPCPQEAQIVKHDLAAIGIALDVRRFSMPALGNREARPGEPYDMALQTFGTEYHDPYLALNVLLDSNLARRGEGVDNAHFVNPSYNRRLEAAAKLIGAPRYREYARLDRELARDAAPWASFGNETLRTVFSARIGCQLYQPEYEMDLAALCVRG